jgi:RNA polymerase sigma-70 factor (ECF subfamily)
MMTSRGADKSKEAVLTSGRGVVVAFARGERDGVPKTEATNLMKSVADLFRDHHDRLVRFLAIRLGSMAEAQEVAQEAYMRLLQRHAVQPDDNLRALLYVTARNVATDRLRQRKLQDAHQNRDDWSEADVATPERIVSDRQALARIQALIDELPPKCSYAFVSYKFHGMGYAEIAYKMGLTESMVRKHVLRAVAHCVSNFDRQDDTP